MCHSLCPLGRLSPGYNGGHAAHHSLCAAFYF